MSPVSPLATDRDRKKRERGQVLVIFAGGLLAFMALSAVVVDLAWYWSSNLRIQRAADAAALAGAVDLPGNVAQAYSDARAEATKNGFTDGVNGYTVTPQQDSQNPRQLNVTISGPVGTFFMHVVGITSIPARQSAKAEFVLPVPMGSPQNYYGVGEFVKDVITVTNTNNPGNTGFDSGSAVSGNPWTNPGNADGTSNNVYATSSTNNQAGQWQNFGLQSGAGAIPSTAIIDGVEVQTEAKRSGSSGCTLRFDLSWNGGTTWSSTQSTAALTTSDTVYTLGSAVGTALWGAHSWVYSDFSNTNFRLRMTFLKSSCTNVSVDTLAIRISYHTVTTTTTTTPTVTPVTSPSGGALTPQNFWGAVITLGGQRQNGDEFSPANDGGSANADFNANGYDYNVEVGASGSVYIYDPTFCAVDPYKGTGDHWIGGSDTPVSTVFSLWNTNGTPYTTADDTQVATSGSLFTNEDQSDQSGNYGSPPTGGGIGNCASSVYHNAWWQLRSGLTAGTYRLNVSTNQSGNSGTNAENMWSIYVSGGSTPKVYGAGSMAAYNNLQSGVQLFYLAQIDAANAGKTMQILLFDPGDVNGDATLRIKSPDGNAYNYATFDYTTDGNCIAGRSDACSATGRTSIQTATGGSSSFNNTLITITIPLPSTYGSVGLTPAGETQAGWWKIEYTISGASADDTTTWRVNLRGNPVHLKVP